MENPMISNEQYKNIIENSFDAVVLFDHTGKLTFASSAVTRILGYDTREVIGLPYHDFLVSPENTEISEKFISVLGGSPLSHLNVRVKKKDGTDCVIEGNATATFEDDHISGIQVIFRDVTERKAAEELLIKEQLKLEMLTGRIIVLQEEERTRLAFTLHDQIGQPLNIIKLMLNKACTSGRNVSTYKDSVKKIMIILDELIDLINTLSLDLRPKLLDDLGLMKALKWYFERYKKMFNIDVFFEFHDDDSLPIEVVNTVYRVIQEALNNVVRHANAKSVKVTVRVEQQVLHLSVEDNGIGFDVDKLTLENALGINIMKERFKLMGGELIISSKPGDGTMISGRIPYNDQHAETTRQGVNPFENNCLG